MSGIIIVSLFKKFLFLLALALALPSCNDEAVKGAVNDGTGGGTAKPSLLESCKNWGSSSLCLLTEGVGIGTSATPTLTFKGLEKINGRVRLFSDSACSDVLGSPVIANVATVNVTAPAQRTFTAEYYAQYTHVDSNISPCLGPVIWTVEVSPTLDFSSSAFSVPTFTLSGLTVQAGSVELFSDSACSVSISDPVIANSDSHEVAAHALVSYGTFDYYAQHTDTAEQAGDCIGPVSYDFVSGLQDTDPVVTLDSSNNARDDDATPTIRLTNLEFESGKIQLFSDQNCSTTASSEVSYSYSSLGVTITANALGTFGSYNYWAKITENIENQSRCMGPVAYEYVDPIEVETLTLALSSSNTPLDSDSTPILEVAGLVIQNGTVQLFSDSVCSISASNAVTVSSETASIVANVLAEGIHQFYVQHTGSNNKKGDCFGSVAYRYSTETLTLALVSPNTQVGYSSLVTLSVTGFEIFDGTVQLFSDTNCSTIASDPVSVSSSSVSITTNPMSIGNYEFYAQHIDAHGYQGSCTGSVVYEYREGAKAISTGYSHACAILNDDSLKCWGNNYNGQLGDGTTTRRNSPTEVDLGNGRTAKDVQAASSRTCAILDDDSLKCWGFNDDGELGDGTTTDRHTPAAVDLGTNRTAKAVFLSARRTCAILDNDSLKCWGSNSRGALGDGTTTDRNSPTAVDLGTNRTAKLVSFGGNSYTCAILDNDSLKCWGGNSWSQLGDGTTTHRNSPTAVLLGAGKTAKTVSTGYFNSCAILDDNSIKCWGENNYTGLLGNGSTAEYSTPVAVNLGESRTAKAIGIFSNSHSCAILDDDSLKCWGLNSVGQLGIDSENNDFCTFSDTDDGDDCKKIPTSVNLGTDRTAKAVFLGSGRTCAILDNDSLKCWGENDHGQLGDGTTSNRNTPTTVDLGTNMTAKAVNLGDDYACAILDDNSIKCWGENNVGQLGDGTTTDRSTPTLVDL